MSAPEPELELLRCGSCQTRYLPTDGPCPHCGSIDRSSYRVPPIGTVLSATELVNPATGWPSPHRLAFVELADSVRALVIVEGALPARGDIVTVRREGETFRARAEPAVPEPERGEGESPRAGVADPSFEPPR